MFLPCMLLPDADRWKGKNIEGKNIESDWISCSVWRGGGNETMMNDPAGSAADVLAEYSYLGQNHLARKVSTVIRSLSFHAIA